MIVKNIFNQALIKLSDEINQEENKLIISEKIIQPIISSITQIIVDRFYFFLLFGVVIILLTFLFAFIIMVTIFIKR